MDRSLVFGGTLGLLASLSVVAGCGGQTSQVPLRRVVLHQNGIGYFERSGGLEGDELRLRFRPHEADDALKTLIVIEQQSQAERRRRSPVAVSAVVPQPGSVDGDVERDEDSERRSVGLSVRLSRPSSGELFVAYAIPTPTWRAVYRVVLPEERGGDEGLLQAFALINNVSDEDWNDVELILATGEPFTYAVDLRTPQFVPRPDVTGRLVEPVVLGAVRAESSRQRSVGDDEDGVAQQDDLCPHEPEDLDQFEDDDGCPDPDNDEDRILDEDDLCPNAPEMYNGTNDEDGCPDRGSVEVVASNIAILDKVYFTHDSGTIREASHSILDAIVATLDGNPQITLVEVAGHAADNESDPWGTAAERAGAVKRYLVEAGVDANRLEVRSYGASLPVNPGTSEDAREENRRVEFSVRQTTSGPVHEEERPISARTLEQSVSPSVPAEATTEGTRYVVGQHVSVPAGSSTLVPLVNQPLEMDDVLLFRPDASVPGSDDHPLRAARIENTSGLDLVAGPLSIFARGSFVGEGLLNRVHSGDTTFVPYAVDESTWVSSTSSTRSVPHRILALSRGVLVVEDIRAQRTIYRLNVGERTPERVYLRHSPATGYEPQDLPSGTEETVDGLLIPISITPGRVSVYTAVGHRPERRRIRLLDDHRTLISAYLEASDLDEDVAQGLRRVIEHRDQLREIEEQLGDLRERAGDLGVQTSAIRSSLEATDRDRRATADLRRRLLERLEETTSARDSVSRRLAELSARRVTLRAELAESLRELSIEEQNHSETDE